MCLRTSLLLGTCPWGGGPQQVTTEGLGSCCPVPTRGWSSLICTLGPVMKSGQLTREGRWGAPTDQYPQAPLAELHLEARWWGRSVPASQRLVPWEFKELLTTAPGCGGKGFSLLFTQLLLSTFPFTGPWQGSDGPGLASPGLLTLLIKCVVLGQVAYIWR